MSSLWPRVKLLLLLALLPCCRLPDQLDGVWDRTYHAGVATPIGITDRLTVYQSGAVTKDRFFVTTHGRWAEDSLGGVTLSFPGDETYWSTARRTCVDGRYLCITMSREGVVDWYQIEARSEAAVAR